MTRTVSTMIMPITRYLTTLTAVTSLMPAGDAVQVIYLEYQDAQTARQQGSRARVQINWLVMATSSPVEHGPSAAGAQECVCVEPCTQGNELW